ncbi:ferric reductase-like transmembrane domain-containing protein [Alcaligenaceae bacterium CGII-47]|nr:ferric reductase-like transmembrane domain-containing protein [Alcaligenaceae bacterium CGII-47]
MKTLLAAFLASIAFIWGWHALYSNALPPGDTLWLIRQEGLYLTGLLSISLMSLVMLLATRPAWLETPLGGMDRVYRLHKWAGILAIGFAAMHWLLEMSSDLIKASIGKAGRPSKADFAGFTGSFLRDFAEDFGEWVIYAMLIMLVLTLWKRFPYKFWHWLHRGMPVLYLMLVFHTVVLTPSAYWSSPIGALLAILLIGGTSASIMSLSGRIGKRRKVQASIVAIGQPSSDVTQISCQIENGWAGHQPGQFAFVTFNRLEGAHPFTIASADRGDGRLVFQIKALGDYTHGLAHRLSIGQEISIEGPYGRFDFRRGSPRVRQVWVAGGIGITPFIAWLEFLQDKGALDMPETVLHYSTRDACTDPFVRQLEQLCAKLPHVQLRVHDSKQGNYLTAEILARQHPPGKQAEIWFCGPQGMLDTLKAGLTRIWNGKLKIHQEAFQMR